MAAAPKLWLIDRIVSGGQTGVDRAALDFALRCNIEHRGWCPKGRMAADGPLPLQYCLLETTSTGYRQRTKLNVRDSDATLIFNLGELDGGTLQTVRFAQTLNKPYLLIQLDNVDRTHAVLETRAWLTAGNFAAVNVAGPREEKRPGIYELTINVLAMCLRKA